MVKRLALLLLLVNGSLACACGRHDAALSPKSSATPAPGLSASEVAQTPAPANTRRASYKPPKGFVPDEQTAISIAVAVWTPIYGKEQIESERPFKASLHDGVWHVTGTLPEGWYGGTAIAEISQESGCILSVIHQK
ncbi:MAG TPA: YbbC/YhhH family protein [Pyrinomonadaceae bacterium]|nr:YbbC/YhhH family protein [Pyrinomonadaceae bacterium]